jgi:hypothetical protein
LIGTADRVETRDATFDSAISGPRRMTGDRSDEPMRATGIRRNKVRRTGTRSIREFEREFGKQKRNPNPLSQL